MRKAWYWLTLMMTCLVLIAGTVAVIVRMNNGRFLTVGNQAMTPALKQGDLVIMKNTSPSTLRVGDVVAYQDTISKALVVHRVIATPAMLGEDLFQTKGDVTTVPDQPVRAADITGHVNYVVPKLGYVVEMLRNPIGMALIIYVPALIILANEIRRLSRYYARRHEYLDAGFDPDHKPAVRHFHFRGPWVTRQG